MRAGKYLSLAGGAAVGAIFFAMFAGLVQAGEAANAYDSLVSLRGNARVAIGGEFLVDFRYRRSTDSASGSEGRLRAADFAVTTAALRLAVDAHPNVGALFKINFTPDSAPFHDREIIEDALIVMKSIGGAGFDFFSGMGRAPYGQDVTLGMIQSYHHAANRAESPEGPIFLVDPPGDARVAPGTPGEGGVLPPMRPGQLDRSIMTGAAYQPDDRWRFEAAMFRPDYSNYRPRLRDGNTRNRGGLDSDVAVAARLWFMPFEDLVVQASGLWLRSGDMGTPDSRVDLVSTATGRKNAFAVSLGFDWRRDPWMAFAEYQHGWDWNFTKGYDTDTWQIGTSRNFGPWRLGAMAEGLRIRDRLGRGVVDEYFKVNMNIRREFSSALFILAEYGREWFRRDRAGSPPENRWGDFFGIRMGFDF